MGYTRRWWWSKVWEYVVLDITFAKQIGLINFLFRGLVIKFLRKLKKDKFIYKTLFGKNYPIYNWDPSGAEVFLTQCFTDWGNEYFFLDSFKDRKNGIFLDIGCHSGYYSILYSNYFNKIVGFEPNSKCIEILKNLENERFNWNQNFVGNKSIEVKSKENPNGYSFYDNSYLGKDFSVKSLSQITLDNYCKKNELSNISAIKVDVDGIDLEVLQGANEIIDNNRPCIMIENYSIELFKFFKDKNYSFWTLSSSKDKPYDLQLEEITDYDPHKWVKMINCIPNEFKKEYKNKIFKGNFLTGINKNEILKTFNVNY